MKLSERFDRRYQQAPTTTVAAPPAAARPADGVANAGPVAPPERRVVPREGAAPTNTPDTEQFRTLEQSTQLSPALGAAKAEIHALLLTRHAAAIDINNRAGIRRLLMQLTEDHFRGEAAGRHGHADRQGAARRDPL